MPEGKTLLSKAQTLIFLPWEKNPARIASTRRPTLYSAIEEFYSGEWTFTPETVTKNESYMQQQIGTCRL